jgi:hypothetical protein
VTIFNDLTGETFGSLIVLEQATDNPNCHSTRWLCKCVCGNTKIIYGCNLVNGRSKSCGCLSKMNACTHRLSETIEYRLWRSAKGRAERKNIPFNLKLDDLIELKIPEICPVLGVPLKQTTNGKRGCFNNSPTLDRIIPELGYVKGNVAVISAKANRLKNNGTIDEFLAIIQYLRKHQAQ